LDDNERSSLLRNLSIDELTDFFDELSDDELKKYLKLLHKKDREKVISLLKFAPESAGSIMHTNVITLMEDFTVEKSIYILQKIQPSRDLHERIFVTNQNGELVGYILLADLVLKTPKTRISSFMRESEIAIPVDENQREIAQMMKHYSLMIAPVVDKENDFLGIISSDTLVEIIEKEASEDIYRMAAVTPIKRNYFETSFVKLFYQRSTILIILFLLQSVSGVILQAYEATLAGFFGFWVTMLISTGGNTSSQTSALAIQGLATGEIDHQNKSLFIKREMLMATALGLVLAMLSFARTFIDKGNLLGSFTVSISLLTIIFFSMLLGSTMPIILKKLGFDPAHAAGPILATLIDVVGLFIYCVISRIIFS
jgi:magnesium transporter